MNYSHDYHAGNFADVIKHWVQCLCIQRMQHKATPMAIIDTHAGSGLYDLTSTAAKATLEYEQGIARLFQQIESTDTDKRWMVRPDLPPSLAGYIQCVQKENLPGKLTIYPGSAAISALLLRPHDRLVLYDTDIEAYETLRAYYPKHAHINIHHANAYQAALGILPPPERRGLVIVDPPFESKQESQQLVMFIAAALKRFAHGTYLIWYPIKHLAMVETMKQQIRALGDKPVLCIEGWLTHRLPAQGLAATGLLLINPPHGIFERVSADLPWLLGRLSAYPTSRAVVTLL